MSWIGALFARLSGEGPPVAAVEHAELGRIRPSHRPKDGLWLWEMLDWVETPRGKISLTWDGGQSGITAEQVELFHWIRDHIDPLTMAAAPLIAPELEEGLEKPFPSDPWQELSWEGAHLPADGSIDGEWDLSYSVQQWPDALVTVYFKRREPTLVQIDD